MLPTTTYVLLCTYNYFSTSSKQTLFLLTRAKCGDLSHLILEDQTESCIFWSTVP